MHSIYISIHVHITFCFLSSLHSYCMLIFSVTCSMSLAYLLSILLLYSYFYTLHIPYSFYNLLFFISYHYFSDYVNIYHTFHISLRRVKLILYYHIIYCHWFSHILSWLYTIPFVIFYFHVLLSCTVFIYCFPVILFILLSLPCTVLVHILFVYCTLYFPYTVFMYYVLFIYCHISYTVILYFYCIIILTFQIILHSYTFSYIMSVLIILCYRTYHHIAVLCFSDHIISFYMSYSNHLFYVSCLHKP